MGIQTRRPRVLIFEGEAKASVGAAESFARRGFHVVVASARRFCFGFYTRYTRERLLMPSQMREPQRCAEFLLNEVRRRRYEFILPLGDEVTQLVCERRDEFMRHGKLVLVPHETFMIGRDKCRTMKAAAAAGVPIPRTWYPDEQPLEAISREVSYPVLVKPACSNGARGIVYAHSAAELAARYAEVSAEFGKTFVQELIPHAGMQFKTELLLAPGGEVLAQFAYKKIRFYPVTGGSSTLNQACTHPQMVADSIRLARSIGWYGMCDFDYIEDVRDGQCKLMEINPRVTDTIQIAQFGGVDFFALLYELACGRAVTPRTTYPTGFYMRFLPGELAWFLNAGRQRWRSRPSFFDFLNPHTRSLVCSWRDPGPTMAYVLDSLGRMFNAKERRYLLRTRPGAAGDNGR
ncbi:MAG: ATP-grasp domain-containing protein [Phycisphaerae bacterium]